jgi:exopolysaccharide biosynthesis polyprenyl glycosylphosphotransferase
MRRVTAGLAGNLRICFDLVALLASWEATISLRLWMNPYFPHQLTRTSLEALAPRIPAVLASWLAMSVVFGLYGQAFGRQWSHVIARTTKAALLANLITIAMTFYTREFGSDLSRSFVVLFLPVSVVFYIGAAYAALALARMAESRLPARKRIAIVGHGEDATRMIERIERYAGERTELAGLITNNGYSADSLEVRVRQLGSTKQLAELINRERLERIIVAARDITEAELEECSRVSMRMGVTLSRPVPVMARTAQALVSEEFGFQTVDLSPLPFGHGKEIVKRIFDIVGSVLLLVFFLPPILILAVLIRWTSPGPAFYRSTRVGKGGRHFLLYKLRSMRTDLARNHVTHGNEQTGHLFKIKNDPRITPLGKFIRRYSLDELPQLFNVLLGDMSLVGPRPLPAEDMEPDGMSKEFHFWAEQRSLMNPGLTGLWQVSGRGDTGFQKMVELDVEYMVNWSLWLDIRILATTPLVVFQAKGAY